MLNARVLKVVNLKGGIDLGPFLAKKVFRNNFDQ
jgi:hypothetical protein